MFKYSLYDILRTLKVWRWGVKSAEAECGFHELCCDGCLDFSHSFLQLLSAQIRRKKQTFRDSTNALEDSEVLLAHEIWRTSKLNLLSKYSKPMQDSCSCWLQQRNAHARAEHLVQLFLSRVAKLHVECKQLSNLDIPACQTSCIDI